MKPCVMMGAIATPSEGLEGPYNLDERFLSATLAALTSLKRGQLEPVYISIHLDLSLIRRVSA